MTLIAGPDRPPAWEVLDRALTERRPVRARYHGTERVLCPHALGWKNGRPKVLAYQAGGTTSHGTLPYDPRQRWRSMFVDEIEEPRITGGGWETADNYSYQSNCIDQLDVAVMTTSPHRHGPSPTSRRRGDPPAAHHESFK